MVVLVTPVSQIILIPLSLQLWYTEVLVNSSDFSISNNSNYISKSYKLYNLIKYRGH